MRAAGPSASPFPLRLPMAALLVGFLAWTGASIGAASPAQAQGTLVAPGGQKRVTAPGGLRGRAAMRQRRIHHRRR